MKKTIICLSLFTITSVLFTGCTAPNAMQTKTDPTTGNSAVRTQTNNPILATRIGVSRVNMTTLGDIKRASLALKNGWFYAQSFQYKIVWFDAEGTEINPEGAIWKPISLQGREVKTVQSVAPNSGAVDVLIYMKKD
ncbi:YcfL family protein [Acinetobacter seifertii]|uniref:YcfL family protein n=1 Tax=Acinetobacter seifertii TaxID=1530123 RepID=UPI001901AE3B|nr:DUF1425 domain-containing protein [Acinetobacter seifertii]MBJ8505944.1 YcfL family protein [Acinetobacter seifertii]